MKKIAFTLVAHQFVRGCEPELGCPDFKEGTYKFADDWLHEVVTRTEKKQIERNPETGIEMHYSIDWTSDCTYTMTREKIENVEGDYSQMLGQKTSVEILTVTKDTITVKTTDENDEVKEVKFVPYKG